MMRAPVAFAAFAAVVTLACATSGGVETRVRTGQDVIGEAEIASRASEAANAFQVIEKLRPQMLRSRGLGSPTDPTGETARPKVYVDNISYGDLSTLSNLMASQIKEIRFVNSRDATTQWGTGHMGGVIHILTKR